MSTPENNPPPNAPDPLAVALSKLEPSPHGFEWNSLMFAAGQASKARALAFWRAAALLFALLAAGFAYAYFTRPPVVVVAPVYVQPPHNPGTPSAPVRPR
jgi:hypothetical protein